MPPWARVSDLDRILRCTGSLLLDITKGRDKVQRSKGLIEAGEWGTDMHEYKATGVPPERRKSHKPFLDRAAVLDREALYPAEDGQHEVSYAIDVLTWEVSTALLEKEDDRTAWKLAQGDACITGTADWVGTDLGRPWVDDLKTGHNPPDAESYQNQGYGLALYLLTKEYPVLSSTHFPRYPKGEKARRYWAKEGFMAARVEPLKRELQTAYAVYQRQRRPAFVAGPYQCAYCPVKEKCPV